MKPSPNVTGLVNQMPDLDKSGKLTGPEHSAAEKVYNQVFDGGRNHIIAIVDTLLVPGAGDDYKSRYLLHGLAVYVCRPEAEERRLVFTEALASQLGSDRPKEIQTFLVRQLQVAGGNEVVGKLGTLLVDEELCEPAAQGLIAINDGVVERFRQALPQAKGKVRLTVIQALGVLADAGSTDALKAAASDQDRDIRLASVWALANIGDAGAVDVLLAAADARGTYERAKVTSACLLLAEKLLAAGRKPEANRVYSHLHKTRTDPSERHIQEAAGRGLAASRYIFSHK